MGDSSNLVLILAGELLKKAEPLLVMGLHPSDVIQGYELAAAQANEILTTSAYSPLFLAHGGSTLRGLPHRNLRRLELLTRSFLLVLLRDVWPLRLLPLSYCVSGMRPTR